MVRPAHTPMVLQHGLRLARTMHYVVDEPA